MASEKSEAIFIFNTHRTSNCLRNCGVREYAHFEPFGGGDSFDLASVTTISRTTGWPSVISFRWLFGNLASSDNSIRCKTVSIRRRWCPRTVISCVVKTSWRFCSSPLLSSSAKMKWLCGNNSDLGQVSRSEYPTPAMSKYDRSSLWLNDLCWFRLSFHVEKTICFYNRKPVSSSFNTSAAKFMYVSWTFHFSVRFCLDSGA